MGAEITVVFWEKDHKTFHFHLLKDIQKLEILCIAILNRLYNNRYFFTFCIYFNEGKRPVRSSKFGTFFRFFFYDYIFLSLLGLLFRKWLLSCFKICFRIILFSHRALIWEKTSVQQPRHNRVPRLARMILIFFYIRSLVPVFRICHLVLFWV